MDYNNNRLTILEHDTIFNEQYSCPYCKSNCYSGMAIENNKVNFVVAKDSKASLPSFLFLGKCACGKMWVENMTPEHHRSHIRNVWMRNFK